MFVEAFNIIIIKESAILRVYNDVLISFRNNAALDAEAARLQGNAT